MKDKFQKFVMEVTRSEKNVINDPGYESGVIVDRWMHIHGKEDAGTASGANGEKDDSKKIKSI